MIDIFNNLKSKKIIKKYSFWGLMKNQNVTVTLGKTKRDFSISIVFNFNNYTKEMYVYEEASSAREIQIMLGDFSGTKLDLFLLVKKELMVRINGFALEDSFEDVLVSLKQKGKIGSFRKSTQAEDRDQDFDWLITLKSNDFKVNIVSSEGSVRHGKKKDVIYFDLKNSKDPEGQIMSLLSLQTS